MFDAKKSRTLEIYHIQNIFQQFQLYYHIFYGDSFIFRLRSIQNRSKLPMAFLEKTFKTVFNKSQERFETERW